MDLAEMLALTTPVSPTSTSLEDLISPSTGPWINNGSSVSILPTKRVFSPITVLFAVGLGGEEEVRLPWAPRARAQLQVWDRICQKGPCSRGIRD
jgi:hypothetical protein